MFEAMQMFNMIYTFYNLYLYQNNMLLSYQ
jgi:hypothetical protein